MDPSGNYLATASEDGTVIIWDPESGRQLSVLEQTSTEILRVCWGPYIPTNVHQIFCFGCSNGEVHMFTYHTDSPWILTSTGVLDHGDGQIYHCQIIAGFERNLTQDCPAEFDENSHLPNLSDEDTVPIKLQIVTACDDAVFVWEVQTQQKVAKWRYPKVGENSMGGPRNPENLSYIFGMAISSNKVAAALSDGTVRINELAGNHAEVAILQAQEKTHFTSVLWSPDESLLLSCTGSGLIFLWNSTTWGNESVLVGHSGPVYGGLFFSEAIFISWSSDCTLNVWDVPGIQKGSREFIINPVGTHSMEGFPIYSCGTDFAKKYLFIVGGGNEMHGDCGSPHDIDHAHDQSNPCFAGVRAVVVRLGPDQRELP